MYWRGCVASTETSDSQTVQCPESKLGGEGLQDHTVFDLMSNMRPRIIMEQNDCTVLRHMPAVSLEVPSSNGIIAARRVPL